MNRGVGSSCGAITIMNAIPTGMGSALGINLQTDAEVIVDDGRPSIQTDISERGEEDLLVRECIKGVFDRAGREIPRVAVRTRSSIPISRGLKSSSAAANAITLAAVRAIDLRLDDLEIIKLGVEAARRAEVTVTGAFDDATACYFGGIVVTNNSEMEIMRRESLSREELQIILHVPGRKIRKRGISRKSFEPVIERFDEVKRLVEDADYLGALTLNGRLCSEALGLRDNLARDALEAGALAAGLTGTGPATAIICDRRSFEKVMSSIRKEDADIIVARPNDKPATEVSERH